MRNKTNILLNELLTGKVFYAFLVSIIITSSVLNWNADLMNGILPYYNDFSIYFSNGFSYNEPFEHNIYTWPMWGYGLVLLLNSKLLIIAIQQLLTLLVIIIVRTYLKNRIDNKSFKIVSFLLLCALPWYFFQVSLWPYGISANLLTISLLLLSVGLEKSNLLCIFISALCFGIMLNLRSDYFYFAFFVTLAVVLLNKIFNFYKKASVYISFWLSIIIISLVPWAIYSYEHSGNFSFVSSNSGHVFYISLGQLPNNKWNITPSDGDVSMRKYIDSNISTKESTLTSRSSKLLMVRFSELVKNDPQEYLKKCFFNFKSFILNPFYLGSVHLRKNSIDKVKSEFKKHIINNNYGEAFKLFYIEFGWYVIFPFMSYLIGQLLMTLVVFSLFNFFRKIKKLIEFNFLNLLIILVLVYQIALNVLTYYLPIYSTNIFLLLIILVGLNLSRKGLMIAK